MSTQLSLLAEDTGVPPPGLVYRPEFLSPDEQGELIEHIYAGEWLADLARRVQHFGYKYDYSNRKLDDSARIGPLPQWLMKLAYRIQAAAVEEGVHSLDARRPFEQAIVNEYEVGQGIAPHIDRDCFGPVVATVSLGSAVNMEFRCDATGGAYAHRLEPGSLLLLCGEARSKWRHGIAKRRSDTWNGQKLTRERRVSITFRTIARPDASIRP